MNNQTFIQKIKSFISNHKIWSIIILIVLIYASYYFVFKAKANTETRYVTSVVSKGNIIVSVSGSGQVSTSNQIDLKAKNSGTVVYVGAKPGDVVKAGRVLFSIDATSAKKAVRDAEINLENAQISLDKLKIQNSNANMSISSQKVYDDGFSAVSNTFLDLPSTISGLDNILGQSNLSDNAARNSGKTALDYRQSAEEAYSKVKDAFDKNIVDFRLVSRDSSKTDIENIINETYDTTVLLDDAIKNTKNFVDYISGDTKRPSDFTSSESTLSTYTTATSGHLSSLYSAKTDIKNNIDNSSNSDLDIQASMLSVEQRQNALGDARDALADYSVYAPFNGTISSVVAKVGDVSSGTLGTIITNQKLASISLNEVDIAKIKLGQKVTLTFDAISDLTITGSVAEIDAVGTVSQGVVTYNVKISFDVEDARVKSGMSVSATIMTNTVQDVIIVPNSAIKNKNGISYVEVFSAPLAPAVAGTQGSMSLTLPEQIDVETGLANDTSTEIVGGLKVGDIIVTKTITATAAKATTAPSILGAVSGNKTGGGGGGNAMRAVTGR